MTTPSGVNIPLMLMNHLPSEVRTLRGEITALEATLAEKRAQFLKHQQLALVMDVDLDAPAPVIAPAAPLADADEPKD